MKTLRGMHDLLDQDALLFEEVISYITQIAKKYSFQFARTPVIESVSLFNSTLDIDTDIMSKEIYTFRDKSNDLVALRPEFTASMMRLFANNNFKSYKNIFTYGPLFRYDRPQKGRYREFYQINFEILNTDSYISDVHIILLIDEILSYFGIKYSLELNTLGFPESREKYELKLKEFFIAHKESLSSESQSRLENNKVLRILDSKLDIDKEVVSKINFKILDFLTKKEKDFYNKIKDLLSEAKITFIENEKLVRGLNYYNNTIFEFISLEDNLTIAGGGRYDAGKFLKNKFVPSVGFAAGIERMISLIKKKKNIQVSIEYGIYLMNFNAERYFFHSLKFTKSHKIYNSSIKLNKFIARCQKENIKHICIIGDKEIEENLFEVKNLLTQKKISYNKEELKEVI